MNDINSVIAKLREEELNNEANSIESIIAASSDSEKIKVIYKKFKDGEIIAIFPDLPGKVGDKNTCESYMLVGEHSYCEKKLIKTLKNATQQDYRKINSLLQNRYNNKLDVINEKQSATAL